MSGNSLSQQKAQLDKAEREQLEDVVERLRGRVESHVRFQLKQRGLDEEPSDRRSLNEDTQELVDAIELEGADAHGWTEAFETYIAGVGYTIVNRLAALRCMEVREFIDEEVTVFKQSGLTPAAETLVRDEYLLEDEAILASYHNACDELADEIEILFDRSTAYSLVDPDDDTFEELCGILDEIPDEVWRADDVLGWVYEYYNRPVVEALDAKNTLEPEDVGPANQFYTPHWVVRMLADNSLGKLYLEATDQTDAIPDPEALSPDERKDRLVTPADAPSVPDLCTYLIPDEEPGDAPEFDHPRELRVIDPACGSGHFLLYAFDILERIWWAETDLDRAEIPAKVLEHNLYGVDIDLRSCQLSAFNLYLKARTRAEEEDGAFEMPNVGIVCADARVAEVEEATDVLDEITGEGSDLREALDDVIETFQHTEALGSLLDVSGTLEEAFDSNKMQAELSDYNGGTHQSLNSFLKALRRAVEDRTGDSFGEQNLRSFLNLMVVLTQEYDTALMNPPYGSSGRMPDNVQAYVEQRYKYTPEYYINFLEVCNRIAKPNCRVGMIVQRSFMYKKSFEDFRGDFIGDEGGFDFLAEFGNDVLDNATVRTAGTIVRVTGTDRFSGNRTKDDKRGVFFRLHDLDANEKEEEFLRAAFQEKKMDDVARKFVKNLSEFSIIPGSPLSYWVPENLRSLYESNAVFDADNAGLDKNSVGVVKEGLTSGNNARFLRKFWESTTDQWRPFAKGGEDAWTLPDLDLVIDWRGSGEVVKRYSGSYVRNEQYYFDEALTYTYLKEGGRRFGYLNKGSVFGHAGKIFIPDENVWPLLAYANSSLVTYLMLSQTPERHWEVGNVAKLPWLDDLDDVESIQSGSKRIVATLLELKSDDITSPYYCGPRLLSTMGKREQLYWHAHPYRQLLKDVRIKTSDGSVDESTPILDVASAATDQIQKCRTDASELFGRIDDEIFEEIGIEPVSELYREIELRTGDKNPRQPLKKSGNTDPETMVIDLLLHFTLHSVDKAEDGIIPLSDIEGEDELLAHIESEFERVWGEHAEARLVEVDNILGNQSAAEEAYPNLRAWLEEDLFDYHVSKFDRTPILWRFTTERLVSDPEGEGFGCLVDYHQLDEGVFDRLQNRYLEPRKNLLRERRSAANRRRGDDSLAASEQAEAAEEYARCESGLEQIEVFEDRLTDLAASEPRDWSTENQKLAEAAIEQVAEFRAETATRLEALEELAALDDVDMGDLFSPTFYETVQENKEEWLDALADLETAFEAYAKNSSEPVEAHLYDLFEYYHDLIGSDHYASNGILFMTYYFGKFEDVGQSKIADGGVSERQRLLSRLARGLDEYKRLAEEVADTCDEISSAISSEWSDRALSEITTAGYRPNHKHGVAINIEPLADAEVVPTTVDDDVL